MDQRRAARAEEILNDAVPLCRVDFPDYFACHGIEAMQYPLDSVNIHPVIVDIG